MAVLFKPSAHKPLASAALVELMPGDVAMADAGDQLKTLLGSCVSVILTDPRRTVAVMCHIVHVGHPNATNRRNTAYGTAAMDGMFAHLRAKGVTPSMCQAYVYGGGNMFPRLFTVRHVGASNAEWALHFLSAQGIRVVDQELGGNGYRKVSWVVGHDAPVVETIFNEQGNANDS